MSSMKRLGERGGSVVWVVLFTVVLLVAIGMTSFGVWAFGSRQEYKNNVDQKVTAAVTAAVQAEATKKDNEIAQAVKSPLKSYTGPTEYGSVSFQYPRTWSGLVSTSTTSGTPLNGYFYPDILPAIDATTQYALRLQVLDKPYDQVLATYNNSQKTGKVKVTVFRAAKVPSVLGSKLEGEVNVGEKDTLVLLPMRDKTLVIYTQSSVYLSDFTNTVLPSLTFSP